MGDALVECSVKRKTSVKNLALLGLVIGLMVAAFTFFIFYLRNGIMFFLGLVLCFLIWKVTSLCDEEYEYIFLNGDLDFARIIGKKKRVELLSISMSEVELVAPASSGRLKPYEKGDRQGYLLRDYSSAFPSHKDRMYVMLCRAEEQAYRIVFEPSEKLLDAMWQHAPRTVVRKETGI